MSSTAQHSIFMYQKRYDAEYEVDNLPKSKTMNRNRPFPFFSFGERICNATVVNGTWRMGASYTVGTRQWRLGGSIY